MLLSLFFKLNKSIILKIGLLEMIILGNNKFDGGSKNSPTFNSNIISTIYSLSETNTTFNKLHLITEKLLLKCFNSRCPTSVSTQALKDINKWLTIENNVN